MGRAKEIEIKVIPARAASEFVKTHHYSGKVVKNSSLHLGAFLDKQLHGVMQFGPSMDKKKTIGLVEGTPWNGFLELNRMAFDDYLPRNSESHCIGAALRLIRKYAPQVKWVVSFADAAQCGCGTIYRASNFILTGIRPNESIWLFPNGQRLATMTLTANPNIPSIEKLCRDLGVECKYRTMTEWAKLGAKPIPGFMLRYVYFIDKSWRKRLTVPELPFSAIDEAGAGMYKGEKVQQAARHAILSEAQKDNTASLKR